MNASRRLWRSGTTSIAPHVIVAGRPSSVRPRRGAEQRHQRIAIPRRGRRIEQRIRVGDAEIVRGVEIVDDQRAGHAVRIEMQIEIAERRRMRGCRYADSSHDRHDEGHQPAHQEGALSALSLTALSHVVRRMELPGKMIRQYAVKRPSATSSVANTRVSVSTRDKPLTKIGDQEIHRRFRKAWLDQRFERIAGERAGLGSPRWRDDHGPEDDFMRWLFEQQKETGPHGDVQDGLLVRQR